MLTDPSHPDTTLSLVSTLAIGILITVFVCGIGLIVSNSIHSAFDPKIDIIRRQEERVQEEKIRQLITQEVRAVLNEVRPFNKNEKETVYQYRGDENGGPRQQERVDRTEISDTR